MAKTLCYSVRLDSLESISGNAYKAVAFDGSWAIIPKSQVFGADYDVGKSEAWWIAAWILGKKDLQYSHKKKAWFNPETYRLEPVVTIEHHVPGRHVPERIEPNATLLR